MTAMQGEGAVVWAWITIAVALLSFLCIWFFVITGRDRKSYIQKRGEETVETYGDIQEDRAPVSKFLIYTYIGVAVWAVGYAIYTGVYGIF